MASLRTGLLFALAVTVGCAPNEPRHTVSRVFAVAGEQPSFALQWDSSELRHPRIDVFSFDGRAIVPRAGVVTSILRPPALLAAVLLPSAAFVLRDANATYALGEDGFTLPGAFANDALMAHGDGFAGRVGSDVLGIDARGRERWRATPFDRDRCPVKMLAATPDRTRVVALGARSNASGCEQDSTLVAYDTAGTPVATIAHRPLTLDTTAAAPTPVTAVRDDLTVLAAGARPDASAHPQGYFFLLRPESPEPTVVRLADWVPQSAGPVGATRWLLVGRAIRYVEMSTRTSTYTTMYDKTEAVLVDDRGTISWRQDLNRSGTIRAVVAPSPRGTALVVLPANGDPPRAIVFAPDATITLDQPIPLTARAAMVEPPIDAATPSR